METIATPYTPKTVSGRMFLRHAIDGDTDRTFYAHCLRHIRNEESSFAMRHAHAWLDWIGYPTKIRLGVTSAESTVQSLTVVESINQKFKVGDRVVYVFCDSDGNETIEYRGLTIAASTIVDSIGPIISLHYSIAVMASSKAKRFLSLA